MRNITSKKLRKIFGLTEESNPIIRRTYRRFKKLYTRTPENKKVALMDSLKQHIQAPTKQKHV